MIPKEYLNKFDKLDHELNYGTVTLILHKQEGKRRYEVGFLESYLPEYETPIKQENKERGINGARTIKV